MQRKDDNIRIKVVCRVKWFNQFKGYGFAESDEIPVDIFIHFSVVNQSNIRIGNGDIIMCEVAKYDKGYQVTKIEQIVQPNKYTTPESDMLQTEATMKWFNPSKGFGFAQLETGEDVFIHSNLLKKYELTHIASGSKIKLLIRHTNFGYEAVKIIRDNM